MKNHDWWVIASTFIVACQIALTTAVVMFVLEARHKDDFETTERQCLFYLLDEDPSITLREAWEECVGA